MRYSFIHGIRIVKFGPYPTEHEAAEAFQRKYGYWPSSSILAVEWPAA